MRIRPIEAEDVPLLAEGLAGVPLLARYGRDAAALARALHDARARGDGLLAAEESGILRGIAWFLPSGTLALGGYLKLIALLPGAEGKGTGVELLRAFERETARASAHAFLLVSDFNDGARRFYEREGYLRVGSIPGLVLPDVAELLYWKRLR